MLENEFDKYASKYDLSDNNLKSRYNHSYRVMNLCIKYAKELGWSDEDVELAKIIGLLHDFGRFEQWKVYKSFSDKDTVDHADYSVVQLFNKNEIVKFTDRVDDYDLIRFAIKNHNKLKIEDCTDERYLRFAKLIRDADKVDILYLLGYGNEITEKGNKENISKEILSYIYEHKAVPVSFTKNTNDKIVLQFSFAFDLNYDIVLPDYKYNLEGFYKSVEVDNVFKDVYKEIINYIDERIDNYVRN